MVGCRTTLGTTQSHCQKRQLSRESSIRLAAGISASMPAKEGIGELYALNPINKYFHHMFHCKECRSSMQAFRFWKNILLDLAIGAMSLAILASRTHWKALFLGFVALFLAGQCCYN